MSKRIAVVTKKASSKKVKSTKEVNVFDAVIAGRTDKQIERDAAALAEFLKARKGTSKEKAIPKPKHRAVVQKKDFVITSNDKRHQVTVSVLFIDDIAIYNDASFENLTKEAAKDVEIQLDKLLSKHLGFDTMINVTKL